MTVTGGARGEVRHARRVAGLLSAVQAAEFNAVAVLPGPNLYYLTGLEFHLSERPILALFLANGPVHFVLPELEASKLDDAAFEPAVFVYSDESGPEKAVRACMASAAIGGRRCGVEERRMRFLEMDLLAHSGAGPALWGADAVFATLRTAKDADEIREMKRAVEIAQTAYERTTPGLRAGVTEREAASRLTAALLEAGSDPELPFFPIVAAGPNGARPHAVPSDRPLEAGDFLIVDWGARSGGYCSDITRTVAIAGAEPPAELVRAYQAVLEGNAAGRAAARPGATGRDVDAAARGVIDAAGFGDAFVHRTGHGLGLETHEEPDMKSTNREPLVSGATFTVEPGVYLPGQGGVRIEDDVVVTASGSESLTTLPREFVVLG